MDNIYTEGICGDDSVILKDGVRMTVTEILNYLNKYQNVSETRPIVQHNHSPGPWKKDKSSPFHLNSHNNETIAVFDRKVDRDACQHLPELIQIAEMYFDYMKSNNQTDSIPFMAVSETLNKLNQ